MHSRIYCLFRVSVGLPAQQRQIPDALRQLILCFQRAATSEESQALSIADDSLYIHYAEVMAKSIHIDDDDDDANDDKEVDQAEKEEISQALRAEQAILADRGAAIMCLMYLSASNGEPNDMVAQTLQLGLVFIRSCLLKFIFSGFIC